MNEHRFVDRLQFLAKFAYVGAPFFGVQEQPGLPTVLGALRTRIETNAQQKARALYISARTDRGVHALENYATFYIKAPVNEKNVMCAIEAPCDDGLFGVTLIRVTPRVHARGNARGKVYRYSILDNCTDEDIGTHAYAWQIAPVLSVEKMEKASTFLLGEQDFSSLRGGGCQAGSPIKNLTRISITRTGNHMIEIEIEGNGFLRKMIRNMVGLLAEIGASLRDPVCVENILAQKKREASGIMAPAHGLCLASVAFDYEKHVIS